MGTNFMSQGLSCGSTSRLLLHEDIHEEGLAVMGFIDSGGQEDARLMTGGRPCLDKYRWPALYWRPGMEA